MLTRRTLRIKVFQALYAYSLGERAAREQAFQYIKDAFAPHFDKLDYNAQEAEGNIKLATLALTENFSNSKFITDSQLTEEANRVASIAHNDYIVGLLKEQSFLFPELERDLLHGRKMYLGVLALLVYLADTVFVEEQERLAKPLPKPFFVEPAHPSKLKLFSNPIIEGLRKSEVLVAEWIKAGLEFEEVDGRLLIKDEKLLRILPLEDHGNFGFLNSLYQNVLKQDEKYKAYQALENPELEDHIAIVRYILKSIIFYKDEAVKEQAEGSDTEANKESVPLRLSCDEAFNLADIHWQENREAVKSICDKTIKQIGQEGALTRVLTLLPDPEDDMLFAKTILVNALKHQKEYEGMIGLVATNWDVERIALADRLILILAMAEIEFCPSIPVKVSINEYLEITRAYSSPESKPFVNGILDPLAKQLEQAGRAKKSARGLIDNK